MGSETVGVLYILDEPSIGLHQRDNDKKLLGALRNLATDMGNIESLLGTMRIRCMRPTISWISDLELESTVESWLLGTVDDIKACKESITGQFYPRCAQDQVPNTRRLGAVNASRLSG